MDFKDDRKLYDAIENMYVVDPSQRTLSTFAAIIGELKDRLHKWTQDGQYGYLFDNVSDTLSSQDLSDVQLQRFRQHSRRARTVAVLHSSPRLERDRQLRTLGHLQDLFLDEAWLFIKNATIRNYVVEAQKTWRKHNAAMILATQSIKELEESGMLEIVSESCPTKIFLANPDMNRELYRENFTSTILSSGSSRAFCPLDRCSSEKRKAQRKCSSTWTPFPTGWRPTTPKTTCVSASTSSVHGIPEGLRQLARDYSFFPHQTSEPTPGCGRPLLPLKSCGLPQVAPCPEPSTDTEIQTGVVQ